MRARSVRAYQRACARQIVEPRAQCEQIEHTRQRSGDADPRHRQAIYGERRVDERGDERDAPTSCDRAREIEQQTRIDDVPSKLDEMMPARVAAKKLETDPPLQSL